MMRFKAIRALKSQSTGEIVKAGKIVTRADFLAPCSDDDINILIGVGAIIILEEAPERAVEEVKDDGTL